MPENSFEQGFFHCKNVSKGSNYFPAKKSKLVIFYLKCTKPKQNSSVWIAECQTLNIIPQICLIFIFKVFGLPPLHMQKAYSKYFFFHNYFNCEPIFKIFAALFRTFGLQKNDMVIFFLWCFRKVRF